MKPSEFQCRVYYEDTDAGGVVYYANYLKFAERARTEALRAAGLEQQALLETQGIAFVVRSCRAEFIRPARLDDLLTIESALHDSGTASLTMLQRILRNGETLVELTVRLGIVNASFRPIRMPDSIRAALAAAFPLTPDSRG